MIRKNKGFSLFEILITLLISGGIVLIFGYLMDKGIKINRNAEKNMDVLNDGLVISEKIYKNMKYSSSNLVTIFPYNNEMYGKDECFAVGFPILSEFHSGNKITPEETGYDFDTYECMDEMQDKLSKKNWSGYVLYIHDKNGDILGGGKNCFYEIKFNYIKSKYKKQNSDSKDIMIFEKLTNNEWGQKLGISISGDNNSELILRTILSKNGNLKKQILSKNIKSFKISKKSYPAFKMRLLLDYGIYGGSNVYGRNNVNAKPKAENFEVDWIVLPINQS